MTLSNTRCPVSLNIPTARAYLLRVVREVEQKRASLPIEFLLLAVERKRRDHRHLLEELLWAAHRYWCPYFRILVFQSPQETSNKGFVLIGEDFALHRILGGLHLQLGAAGSLEAPFRHAALTSERKRCG